MAKKSSSIKKRKKTTKQTNFGFVICFLNKKKLEKPRGKYKLRYLISQYESFT
jgi:hypothetical protein